MKPSKIMFSALNLCSILCLSILSSMFMPSQLCSQGIIGKRTVKSLHKQWEFHENGSNTWYNAEVPGCVHTDLHKNAIIDDPFYRDNELKLQWIGKRDWVYKTTFIISESEKQWDNIEMVFKGLDTYADVFLNDELLLNADNMFLEYRVSCKHLLHTGKNHLRIHFSLPDQKNSSLYGSL